MVGATSPVYCTKKINKNSFYSKIQFLRYRVPSFVQYLENDIIYYWNKISHMVVTIKCLPLYKLLYWLSHPGLEIVSQRNRLQIKYATSLEKNGNLIVLGFKLNLASEQRKFLLHFSYKMSHFWIKQNFVMFSLFWSLELASEVWLELYLTKVFATPLYSCSKICRFG